MMPYNFLKAAGLADLPGRHFQIVLDGHRVIRVLHTVSRRVLQLMLVADFSSLCIDSPGKFLDSRLCEEEIIVLFLQRMVVADFSNLFRDSTWKFLGGRLRAEEISRQQTLRGRKGR
jgi:hypothetical protein